MRIHNAHERVVDGTPEQVAALVADFDAIWPVDIARAPRYFGDGVYAADPMVWEEVARADAARAFRVIHPPGLEAEHWFEVRETPTGTLVRHVISGEARAAFADLWRNRLEAIHDRILEALLDRVAAKARHGSQCVSHGGLFR
jgi:hypothetical protein